MGAHLFVAEEEGPGWFYHGFLIGRRLSAPPGGGGDDKLGHVGGGGVGEGQGVGVGPYRRCRKNPRALERRRRVRPMPRPRKVLRRMVLVESGGWGRGREGPMGGEHLEGGPMGVLKRGPQGGGPTGQEDLKNIP